MCQMKYEEGNKNVSKFRLPDVQPQDRGEAPGRYSLLAAGGRLRGCSERRGFSLHRPHMKDVITAHRRAECPDPKHDLIIGREWEVLQEVPNAERCQHECDRESDVSHAGHLCSVAVWNGFRKEGIETHAKRREW